mmetsp:Transcript_16173/g.36748  ORF Transcript_16173/g.36748 Transcript_16173/m.36748 type:complete len:664 (+) Transcript_16173:262-2253(+)
MGGTDAGAPAADASPDQQMPTPIEASPSKSQGYPIQAMELETDMCFEVMARADCEGTQFASEECQWFHFGLRGRALPRKTKLRFHILGLSRFKRLQTTRLVTGQLLTDGLQPVFWTVLTGWQLVRGEIGMLRLPDGMLAFTFEHTMMQPLAADQELYFALTFPFPLSRIYSHLDGALHRLAEGSAYVHREQLTTSLGGHPIELVTLTRRSHRSAQRQPALPDLIPEETQRPWLFPGRRAIFISARVHPGETPASYMLEGLLDFLASGNHEATELLRNYVIHVIPVLNPDGVAFGHHRLDMRGENLNRVYGKATLVHHPAIVAAEQACLCAHEHQGGLRIYLDLHAHSNRRGAFLLADAGRDAEARLFGWALGRHCNIFEYSQSDFSESKRGTGKSTMAKLTGNPLCYTVECHYIRGHHSSEPFGPTAWRRLGAALPRALLDLDFVRKPRRSLCAPGVDAEQRLREAMAAARRLLTGERATTKGHGLLCRGPSRAAPEFGVVLGPSEERPISRALLTSPELIDKTVEIIESFMEADQCWLRLHEASGGLTLREDAVRPTAEQTGSFFYGALCKVAVSQAPSPTSPAQCFLNPGTVLEVSERCVVDGVLRLRLMRDSQRGAAGGWVSEFKRPCFDPRLGGAAQLLRLRGPPTSLGKKGPCYAFAC